MPARPQHGWLSHSSAPSRAWPGHQCIRAASPLVSRVLGFSDSLPLAVADEAIALYEMQMLLSRLTPAIFISLGNAVARRCNLSGIFRFH
jgi:hypothetical protein